MEQRPDLSGEEPYNHHNAFVTGSPTPDECGFLQNESAVNSNQDVLTCCRWEGVWGGGGQRYMYFWVFFSLLPELKTIFKT